MNRLLQFCMAALGVLGLASAPAMAQTIAVAPFTVSFVYDAGGPLPASQPLAVTTAGPANAAFTTSITGCSWLSATPATGVTPATVQVAVNPAGLTPNLYTCQVQFRATESGNTLTVQVSLTIRTPIVVAPAGLSFSYFAGIGAPVPPQQSVAVSASLPGGTFVASGSPGPGCGWVSLQPSSGLVPFSVSAVANPAGLAAGVHTCVVTFSSSRGSNTPTLTITFTITAGSFQVSPNELTFSDQNGPPAPQTFSITSTPIAGLLVNVSRVGDCGWLNMTPSGLTPLNVTAAVNTAGLARGTHRCPVVVSGEAGDVATLTVNLIITDVLSVSPDALNFSYRAGGPNPASQAFTINSAGQPGVLVSTELSGDCGWLSISPRTGVTPLTITATASGTGVAEGTHVCRVTASGTGARNRSIVTATLTVIPRPVISSAPSSLAFSHQIGAPAPLPQVFTVSANAPGVTVTAAASPGCGWLTLSPSSGPAPLTISATATPAGLPVGLRTCTVAITSAEASNTLSVSASLDVVNIPSILTVFPQSLNFQYSPDATPNAQSVTVNSAPGSGLGVSVSANGCDWLAISPQSGSTPFTFSVIPSSVQPLNTRSCTISVTGANVASTANIQATATLTPVLLIASPASLEISHQIGAPAPEAQLVVIGSAPFSRVTLSVTPSPSCPMLAVNPLSGTAPLTLAVRLNTVGLQAGVLSCPLTVSSSSTSVTNTAQVPIAVRITNTTTLSAAPQAILFRAEGSGAPSPQRLSITSHNPDRDVAFNVNAGAGCEWLAIGSTSGVTPASIDVSVRGTSLPRPTTCTLTISGTGVASSVAVNIAFENPDSLFTITTTSIPNGTQGTAYSTALGVAGGNAPYTWSVASGSLPAGLTLDPSSGAIAGTPSVAGNFPFMVRVTDGSVPALTAEAPFTAQIRAGVITIDQTTPPSGRVGQPYSVLLRAQGGTTPYNWTATGSLPAGLTLDPTTGEVRGVPLVPGTSLFVVQVSDASLLTATRALSITIETGILITTFSIPSGVAGAFYSATLGVQGGRAPFRWSLVGAVPANLSINPSTGTIEGVPSASGNYHITASVNDSSTPTPLSTSKDFEVVIRPSPLNLNCGTLNPTIFTRASITVGCSVSGGLPPYRWSIDSAPPGVGLSNTAGTATTLAGTLGTPGLFRFAVRAADSSSPAAQTVHYEFALTVQRSPEISLLAPPSPQAPATVAAVRVESDVPIPAMVEGVVRLDFAANATATPLGYRDPALTFANGATTVDFAISPEGTTAVLTENGAFQTGTVAGTITFSSANMRIGGTPISSSPLVKTVEIPLQEPVITAGSVRMVNVTPSGFEIELTGYSTARDLRQGSFTFQAAQGAAIESGATVTFDLQNAGTAWYESSEGLANGGAFRLRVPFQFDGDIAVIRAVSVTLTNSIRASEPVIQEFP